MSSTFARMSKKELTEIIAAVVEKKLIELFGDPDEGLVLKEHLRKRLLRQRKAVTKGERGLALSTVRKHLSL